MLDGRMAVGDHRHVHFEQRTAFRHHFHAKLARSLDDHLPLLAAGLVVALDRPGAGILEPAEMGQRVVEAVDLDREGRGRAIEDGAGREDAGAKDLARLLIFRGREDFECVIRWVVDRGHAIAERRCVQPVLLGNDQFAAHRPMPVGVDQARDDGLARHIDGAGSGRVADRGGRTDGGNPVALDQDGAVFDHLVAAHRDDAGTGQRDRTRRASLAGRDSKLRDQRCRSLLATGEAPRRADVLAVEIGSLAPVKGAAIARPVNPVAGIGAELGLRQRLAVGRDVDRPSGADERHDIGLVAFGPGDERLVRRQGEVGCILGNEVGDLFRPGDRDGLQQPFLFLPGGGEEDPVIGGAEHRLGPGLGHPLGGGALDRHDIDARLLAVERRRQETVARLAIGDQAAVGREGRLDIMARLGGHDPAVAAASADHLDPAGLVVVPRDIGDLPSVAGECGIAFEIVAAREASRIVAAPVSDPQIAQRLIDDPRPVRALLAEADHLGLEARRRDVLLLAYRILDEASAADPERDFANLARRDVDAVDSALGPEDDRLAVGRPAHARIDALDCPGFLHVAVEHVGERGDAARLQVHQHQRRLVPDTPDEGQALAVGRRCRPDRSARAGHQCLDLAGLAVEPLDHINLTVDVLRILEGLARRRIVGEIKVAPIGRKGWLVGVLLLGPGLGHLDSGTAAAAVVEPHFAGTERPGRSEMLAGDDIASIRRPIGLVQQAEGLLCDLARAGSVGSDGPDIVATAAIRSKGDLLAIRRIAWLHVPAMPGRNGTRLAAFDRDNIKVAEEVERDLASVGRHVERHPGAAISVDRNVTARAVTCVDVPLVVLFAFGPRRGRDSLGLVLGQGLRLPGFRQGRRHGRRRCLGKRSGGGCKQRAADKELNMTHDLETPVLKSGGTLAALRHDDNEPSPPFVELTKARGRG